MTIAFKEIPLGLRTPGVFVEIDPSRANLGDAVQPYQGLIIGQRLAAGTVAELVPTLATSVEEVDAAFGRGSQIAGMARAWFENNQGTPVTFIALDDHASGVQASGTVTFSGTATAAGSIYLLVAGRLVTAAVASGDAATAVASAVAAAITADPDLPVSASTNAGEVTLTAKNDGEYGNYIDFRVNYYVGQALPAGITVAIVAMASGANNPDASAVWAVLGDEDYNVVAFPYTDAANLTALESELADRWGPLRSLRNVAIASASGTLGGLLTLGDSRNSPHVSIMGGKGLPWPPYERAARIAGIVAREGAQDPARPFQSLLIEGELAPAVSDRFTLLEQDQLLKDGISTFTVGAGGEVRIQSLITTWQENAAGAPDISFLYLNRLLILSRLSWETIVALQSRYPRHKLADDGTNFESGQEIVTPKILRAEIVGLAASWERRGLIEDLQGFKDRLVVERNSTNPERVDVQMVPDLINGARIFAVQLQFLT